MRQIRSDLRGQFLPHVLGCDPLVVVVRLTMSCAAKSERGTHGQSKSRPRHDGLAVSPKIIEVSPGENDQSREFDDKGDNYLRRIAETLRRVTTIVLGVDGSSGGRAARFVEEVLRIDGRRAPCGDAIGRPR